MNWDRVHKARLRGKAMFGVAGFAIGVVVLLLIAAPRFTDPSFGPTPPEWQRLLPYGIGVGGVLFGLAWMLRIYRAPTRNDEALWRYRDR